MPTYTYHCLACVTAFDAYHPMSDSLERCIKCDSKRIERMIGAGSRVVFKGTGFYETDYKQQRKG